MTKIMIYGANGYTGRLVTEYAVRQGLKPILAGRNPQVICDLALEHKLESRIFGLKDINQVVANLADIDVIIHCAGPFWKTTPQILKACCQTQTNYVDITGELEVFQHVFAKTDELRAAGITAIPGAGFDVVPSDFLAKELKEALPDATELSLVVNSSAFSASSGTANTVVDHLAKGGVRRSNGKVVKAAVDCHREFEFDGEKHTALMVPLGDVETAYHTTGVPNIAVYLTCPKSSIVLAKLHRFSRALWRLPIARYPVKKSLKHILKPQTREQRSNKTMTIFGVAENAKGETVKRSISTPEGYNFTAVSAVNIALEVSKKKATSGAFTPARFLEDNFLTNLLHNEDFNL